MIEIIKYPKVERLPIITTTNASGFVSIRINQNYSQFNLQLLQNIFVVSGAIVGKYQITAISWSGTYSLITINLVYSSDTADGYILTNPAINADSYWNSVNFKIDFEFQRKDFEFNAVYPGAGAKAAIQIDGDYSDKSLTVGGGVYVRLINESTGIDILNGVFEILALFYNSGSDLSEILIDTPYTENTDYGFINSNEYKENYYAVLRVETKGTYKEFKIRPDSSGIMYFDASKYLKTKINIADTFDYSTVSFRDENLGNYFTLSYTEISG